MANTVVRTLAPQGGAAVGPSLAHLLLNTGGRLQVDVARLLMRRLAELRGSTFEAGIEAARLIPAHFQEWVHWMGLQVGGQLPCKSVAVLMAE